MKDIRMKLVSMALLAVVSLLASCARKPAYSDIKTESERQAPQAEATGEQEVAPAPPPAEASAPQPSTPQPTAAPEPPKVKLPPFIDSARGGIKDVPSYPNAVVTNAQYGPINGADSAMILLQSTDTVASIAAFYDKAIKSNRWKVVGVAREPDWVKWELMKGTRDEAIVDIRADEETGRRIIIISRAQKPEEPKQ